MKIAHFFVNKNRHNSRRVRSFILVLAMTLSGVGSLLVPQNAIAQTALTRAVIQALRNRVQLIPKNRSARAARPSDTLAVGDALTTARSSMAQLRFNDGSLARLGESVVFRFVPGTRTFQLSNGTALMLIPPGRGTTRVRTPNATAAIRGSALFVRYIPETDTTIVGALTDSGIEVFNRTGSQHQELKPGYMAVIVKDRIERLYEFDLETFYKTSELAAGLNLEQVESAVSSDQAIAQVQSETSQALAVQSPIIGENVIENPSFMTLPTSTPDDFPAVDFSAIENNEPTAIDLNSDRFGNNTDIRLLIEGGEIQAGQSSSSSGGGSGGGNTGGEFPGGGNTGGEFPGGGNTGGEFPGGGNT
ncbi:FecR domain-containing protein, partial [Coleofasciculus sp. LEGE 07081]|uniref:FecR family protein n=1 Tax=Coleofasciculus sp. LEGE 07081 TaxID=2777967 RepID=UPI001D14EC04